MGSGNSYILFKSVFFHSLPLYLTCAETLDRLVIPEDTGLGLWENVSMLMSVPDGFSFELRQLLLCVTIAAFVP